MGEVELLGIVKVQGTGDKDNPVYHPDDASNVFQSTAGNVHIDVNDREKGLRHRPPQNSTERSRDSPIVDTTAARSMEDPYDLNWCARGINHVQKTITSIVLTHQKNITRASFVVLVLLYFGYFAYALSHRFGDEGSKRLLVGTVFAVLLLVVHLTWEPLTRCLKGVCSQVSESTTAKLRRRIRWLLYLVSLVTMVTLLVVLVAMRTPNNLVSLGGLAAFIFISWITSIDPARVNWHPVFWGFSLQFFFACIILKTKGGYQAFKWLGDRVTGFLAYADEGAAFVFGDNFRVHFFGFAVMSMIVFFSSVMSVLYYLGVMQKIVSVLGRFLGFCLGTTAAESLCAAFNIFLGMADAPMMVRPFLSRMTRSELHAIMTGGFATIAGSVLGAYIGFGIPANHLLSASVMSAPAALAISKLTYPETEKVDSRDQDYNILERGSGSNIIEAASAGASNSLVIVGSVAVNLIAFLSLLKFVNVTLTWFGDRVGMEDLTFELICSYVLYPVALFMGVEVGLDCRRVGELVGIKTFTNEFIAYKALQNLMINRQVWTNYTVAYNVSDPANVGYDDLDIHLTQWDMVLKKGILSPRSEVIATYALCGFSNFGSMGIMLGAMTSMAPERSADMAAIVLRAMIAGNVACFFTACIAGLFFEEYD